MSAPTSGFETMWSLVGTLGAQLEESWARGAEGVAASGVREVWVCGMGGSAIAAELLSAVVDPDRIRILVHRGYGLPRTPDPDTLLIFSSYSGNTEEVLSAWDAAERLDQGCARAVISSGGELVARARTTGVPHLSVPPGLPPRASLGHGIGVLCAVLDQVGNAGLRPQVSEAVAVLEAGTRRWGLVSEATDDSLERLAEQLAGRLPILYSGCPLTHAVAGRWRAQINENSKLLASTAHLPELDHNEVVGWGQSTAVRDRACVIALRDDSDHPRVSLRFEATREALGLPDDTWTERRAEPGVPLARMVDLVQQGDVLSCLIARNAAIDPVEVDVIDRIKRRLSSG